jgi:hypothetical protein
MHGGQSTPPNYRGEPEQTVLLQSSYQTLLSREGVACETNYRGSSQEPIDTQKVNKILATIIVTRSCNTNAFWQNSPLAGETEPYMKYP